MVLVAKLTCREMVVVSPGLSALQSRKRLITLLLLLLSPKRGVRFRL